MEILDCDENTVISCRDIIAGNPNPDHLREVCLYSGMTHSMDDVLDASLQNSKYVHAVRISDNDAILCGSSDCAPWTRDILVKQVWMLGTSGVYDYPRQVINTGRRISKMLYDRYPYPYSMEQVIPIDYEKGIRFIEKVMEFKRHRLLSVNNVMFCVFRRTHI